VRKTKIVCTLGPASSTPEQIEALIRAGLDVARLNFSHGSYDNHRAVYRNVRAAAEKVGKQVAILQDLQGPKIRVGQLEGGTMTLEAGQSVVVTPGDRQTTAGVIPTTYQDLPRDARAGDTILMDDGLMRLKVEEVKGQDVRCRVEVGGLLKDRKGINLPGVKVSAPALTEKDLADLAFGVELGVDFLCLSFVRQAADIQLAKDKLAALGKTTPIISKIEKPEAVENLAAILDLSDGIMVARGDLGVEMGPEKVPLIQKQCIEDANERGKLVITATQMLESMVTSSFPTRAEASDVANAVLDQTDAVMLSAETASGKHPVLVVETMSRIITEVEASERYRKLAELPPLDMRITSNAIAHAAAAAATHLEAKAIVCVSGNGGAPRLVSDYRPEIPVLALTSHAEVGQRLAAYWGVHPYAFQRGKTVEETIRLVDAMLIERGLAAKGDTIILTLVVPPGSGRTTNTLKVHEIGSEGF
jgi:pyruvate kinase